MTTILSTDTSSALRPTGTSGAISPARRGNHPTDHHPGRGRVHLGQHGQRYIDGLSGLFTCQVGHGRKELAQAAAKQAETLEFFPLWSYATEPAIELAARLAGYAPVT